MRVLPPPHPVLHERGVLAEALVEEHRARVEAVRRAEEQCLGGEKVEETPLFKTKGGGDATF